MSTLKEYLREVRDATAEHLEARHRDDASAVTQHLPREEALATIALVAIRLLEQQLQSRPANETEHRELQTQLKACRRALKSHQPPSSTAEEAHTTYTGKRSRAEDAGEASSMAASAPLHDDTSKSVELGQYATTDAFSQNAEKRLKFARLMGGAKATSGAASRSSGGQLQHPHHNTHAKNSAEVRDMNERLAKEFESAMSHKGKKGLGA